MPKFDANNQPIIRKPRGKDKKWATLEYWFTLLNKDLKDSTLPISDKVKAELKMIELILGRKPLPSDDQEQSVKNASQLLKQLEDIQNAKSIRTDGTTGETGSMEIGS